MKKVIGGEFQIDDCLLNVNKTSKKDIVLSSGRCALSYILKNIENKLNYSDILIPNYLCDSIINTIVDLNWKYHFYDINQNLEFNINELTNQKKANIILIINYFGMINLNKKIIEIKKKNPDMIIIEDDVQAYFEYEKSVADYSFTSLRKWFPCPDGALIKTMHDMDPFKGNINRWSQYKFAGNILKKYSDKLEDDLISLKLLEVGETLLNKEYYSMCSKFSSIIFSNINIDEVVKKRKENAKFLHEGLLNLKIKHIYSEDAIPLFIPIFINNRNSLRKEFFKNNIFVPYHWPNDKQCKKNILYNTELSLICDQRYDLSDMERQLKILKSYKNCEE